jgi:hypothetical protein
LVNSSVIGLPVYATGAIEAVAKLLAAATELPA